MTTKVFIERTKIVTDGARYRVTREDGTTLIEGSRVPEHDACRALLAEGVTGKLAIWRKGKSHPDMFLDIERAAGRTVSEGKDGIAFRKWKPFDQGAADDQAENVLEEVA